MRAAALVAFLASSVVLGDVLIEQAGGTVHPVRVINCRADAGMLCTRSASVTYVGDVFCNAATSIEPGCVTPADQTWAGKKTLTDRERIVCKAHASLTACAAGEKGTWQSCCDHNAPVYCDGTTNIELTGPSATEKVLGSVYINGIPQALVGNAFTCASACTVTALEGTWGNGSTSDGGTLVFRITDGSNNCDCTQPCAAPTSRCVPSGTCAFAAGSTLTPKRITTTCTANPYVAGNLTVKGTTP